MKSTKLTFIVLTAVSMVSVADVEPIVYDGYPVMSEGKTLYAQAKAQVTNEAANIAWEEFKDNESKVKAYFDEIISYLDANGITTNAPSIIEKPGIYSLPGYVSGGYDAKFAARGQFCCSTYWVDKSPLCFTNWLNDAEGGVVAATNNPVYLEAIKMWAEHGYNGVSLPILFNYYEFMATDPYKYGHYVLFFKFGVSSISDSDKIVSGLLYKVVPEIKKWLRKSGKSFITKEDGVNPVQEEIGVLQTALSTSKFVGLREWVAKIWPDYQWIEPTWKSDEEINQLKEDVFYGQKDFDTYVKIILQSHLGTDAYNAFVEEYNQ